MTDAGFEERPVHFSGILHSSGPGTWTLCDLGTKLTTLSGIRDKIRVRGTLNGVPFESTAIPNGDGSHALLVTKPLQKATQTSPGHRCSGELVVVLGPRPISLPVELTRVLTNEPSLRVTFRALAPSHKREWAEYVRSARRPRTRIARARRVVSKLRVLRRPSQRRTR